MYLVDIDIICPLVDPVITMKAYCHEQFSSLEKLIIMVDRGYPFEDEEYSDGGWI